MSDTKTIAVNEMTKDELVKLKQHERETYDDVIVRLMEWWMASHPAKKKR